MSNLNTNRFEFLFNSIQLKLSDIAQYLQEAGFQTKIEDKHIALHIFDGPKFLLNYAFGEFYLHGKTNKTKAQGATRSISTYSSKIEVAFDNLEEVLDEINSLIELQTTLQEWQEGSIYRYWNKSFF